VKLKHLTSTILRDWERCFELARRRVRAGFYDRPVGDHFLPQAVGVAFDAYVRWGILGKDDRTFLEEQLAWLAPTIRPQATSLGKRLAGEYLRSGALECLLEEGELTANAGEVTGKIGRAGDEGVPVKIHPDCLVREGPYRRRRVLDFKTTGVLRGGQPRPGYLRRWRDGRNLGSCETPMNLESGTTGATWQTQLGFYALPLEIRAVGIDLVVVAPGWAFVEVAQYRWDVSDVYLAELVERAWACWGDLQDLTVLQHLDELRPVEPTPERCYAYRRRCELAETCPYFQAWEKKS